MKDHRLAVTPQAFALDVLRDEGRQLGQYDARYGLPLEPRGTDPTADDPAMGRYVPGVAASFEPFVREQFGVDRDGEAYRAQEYWAVNQRWRWDERNGGEDLAIAMRRSQTLELLCAVGHFDLVTTAGAVQYALTRHPIDPARWRMDLYESGHMVYLGKAPRAVLAESVRTFIARLSREGLSRLALEAACGTMAAIPRAVQRGESSHANGARGGGDADGARPLRAQSHWERARGQCPHGAF